MIADAWYMVCEYHLNLGPNDTLEKAVRHIAQVSGIKSCEKKEVILEYLVSCRDKETSTMKQTLSRNVPYRLQSPFMESMKGAEWKRSEKNLAERINREKRLIYYFLSYRGLDTEIEIQKEWADYISGNYDIIQGWTQYHMIRYLQKRNPGVWGIADKLYAPRQRNLKKVKQYWKTIIGVTPVHEIYSGTRLNEKNISVDHFIPWSYVAHDEMWNLTPTTKSINSSKGSCLPEWDLYFPLLCRNEYLSYRMIWQYPKIHEMFEKCADEHLNDQKIRIRLYRKGVSETEFSGQLKEIILPVYQSARKRGFSNWRLKEE